MLEKLERSLQKLFSNRFFGQFFDLKRAADGLNMLTKRGKKKERAGKKKVFDQEDLSKRVPEKIQGKSVQEETSSEGAHLKVIKKGSAMRVIFFYPGEEGTYVDHADVTLYENGIVHIVSNQEETTTHLQNCEILWRFETESDERVSKVRLLKPKADSPKEFKDTSTSSHEDLEKRELKPSHGAGATSSASPGLSPSKNPEWVE